jgi:glycosyltransferase involved in cell wall biosynthesis
VRSVLRDGERLERMSAAARQHAGMFSWDASALEFEAVLEQVART